MIETDQTVMCGPVAAELAAGPVGPRRTSLWDQLGRLTWVEMNRRDWLRVGEVKHTLDRSGSRVALTDIQIAVCGASAGASVWSFDSDFERIARAMPELRLYQ